MFLFTLNSACFGGGKTNTRAMLGSFVQTGNSSFREAPRGTESPVQFIIGGSNGFNTAFTGTAINWEPRFITVHQGTNPTSRAPCRGPTEYRITLQRIFFYEELSSAGVNLVSRCC